jgi:regulator of RNase E activity RraA
MLQEPQDAIDPQVCDAADDFMGRVSGGFTLNGLVRDVDLLGEYGTGLSAQAGYIRVQQSEYRCMTITIPLLVNDVWTQGA